MDWRCEKEKQDGSRESMEFTEYRTKTLSVGDPIEPAEVFILLDEDGEILDAIAARSLMGRINGSREGKDVIEGWALIFQENRNPKYGAKETWYLTPPNS